MDQVFTDFVIMLDKIIRNGGDRKLGGLRYIQIRN